MLSKFQPIDGNSNFEKLIQQKISRTRIEDAWLESRQTSRDLDIEAVNLPLGIEHGQAAIWRSITMIRGMHVLDADAAIYNPKTRQPIAAVISIQTHLARENNPNGILETKILEK